MKFRILFSIMFLIMFVITLRRGRGQVHNGWGGKARLQLCQGVVARQVPEHVLWFIWFVRSILLTTFYISAIGWAAGAWSRLVIYSVICSFNFFLICSFNFFNKHLSAVGIPDICHFFHGQNFWRMKFTPKKRVNYDKIHKNCQFFALLRQNTQ